MEHPRQFKLKGHVYDTIYCPPGRGRKRTRAMWKMSRVCSKARVLVVIQTITGGEDIIVCNFRYSYVFYKRRTDHFERVYDN